MKHPTLKVGVVNEHECQNYDVTFQVKAVLTSATSRPKQKGRLPKILNPVS